MKSILFVGATLMVGASIYGFVDYRNSSHKKEFTRMYEESPETLPAVIEVKKEKEAIPVVTNRKVKAAKPTVKEGSVLFKSRSKAFVSPVETLEVKTDATVKTDELKETKTPGKIKTGKSKKLNHKLFSRGSLEERYVEKTLNPETKKKEAIKKAEVKEEL